MTADLADAAYRWLARQSEPSLRIAREIIGRRAELRRPSAFQGDDWARAHENGVVDGMLRALAMLGGRPGDISQTGAGGFISAVESADEMVAEAAAKEGAL